VCLITGLVLGLGEVAKSSDQGGTMSLVETLKFADQIKYAEQRRLPVITVCPSRHANDFSVVCRWHDGGEIGDILWGEDQTVDINHLNGKAENFNCKTVNQEQTLMANHGGSEYIGCNVSMSDPGHSDNARVTLWGNRKVWPHTFIDRPMNDSYAWRTVKKCHHTEVYMKPYRVEWHGKHYYWHEALYGQSLIFQENCTEQKTTDPTTNPLLSFSIGYDPNGFLHNYKAQDLYRTNEMLGVVGGQVFLLSLLMSSFLVLIRVAMGREAGVGVGGAGSEKLAVPPPSGAAGAGSYGTI